MLKIGLFALLFGFSVACRTTEMTGHQPGEVISAPRDHTSKKLDPTYQIALDGDASGDKRHLRATFTKTERTEVSWNVDRRVLETYETKCKGYFGLKFPEKTRAKNSAFAPIEPCELNVFALFGGHLLFWPGLIYDVMIPFQEYDNSIFFTEETDKTLVERRSEVRAGKTLAVQDGTAYLSIGGRKTA